MWVIEPTSLFERRAKKWEKKRPRELAAALDNLNDYLKFLNQNLPVRQIRAGFIHVEPKGIVAIDQSGANESNLTVTRLYCFPDEKNKILYLITLGDKKSQSDDIQGAKKFVDQWRQSNE